MNTENKYDDGDGNGKIYKNESRDKRRKKANWAIFQPIYERYFIDIGNALLKEPYSICVNTEIPGPTSLCHVGSVSYFGGGSWDYPKDDETNKFFRVSQYLNLTELSSMSIPRHFFAITYSDLGSALVTLGGCNSK